MAGENAPSKSDAPNERRRSIRHFACVPAHLYRKEGKRRLSMIHDLSITGAFLLTRTKAAIGDPVALTLYIQGPNVPYKAKGLVVRCEKREAGAFWPFGVAVQFEHSIEELEPHVRALADVQAKLGRGRR